MIRFNNLQINNKLNNNSEIKKMRGYRKGDIFDKS